MIEPTAGVFDGREHRLPVRIYYEDTDFSGLVYHANYLRYFERGRSDFFRLVGISHSELAMVDTAFAITRMELDFKKAARVDDALLVRTTYDRVKGARLYFSQTITRGDDLIAQAAGEAVCITLDGRPRKPAAVMVAQLAPWLEATCRHSNSSSPALCGGPKRRYRALGRRGLGPPNKSEDDGVECSGLGARKKPPLQRSS